MAESDIRLVALDLDGTLLTSAKQLPPEGASLLTQAAEKGIHVILATTRRHASSVPFYRQLRLSSPLICGNGAQVWASPDGPLWAEYAIDEQAARVIAQLADERDWELGVSFPQMSYWRRRPEQPLGVFLPDVTVVATNVDAIVGAPLRILTWHPQAIAEIGAFCCSQLSEVCSVEVYVDAEDVPQSLGIFAERATKGVALNLVMERLGVTREQVVTIGDNYNDLAMFACGDVSVAMANAPQQVKEQATLIAPSNDEEGVAWAIKTLGIA
jgi:Cof subfamily protein (haloacid dehalogenase superfamily)